MPGHPEEEFALSIFGLPHHVFSSAAVGFLGFLLSVAFFLFQMLVCGVITHNFTVARIVILGG